ncbi:hypothetical protein GCM10010219_03920 [Streptomyces netropsis]|nr:hypothetical protein GCM10010219_03920 [Streptomyces netropsis]
MEVGASRWVSLRWAAYGWVLRVVHSLARPPSRAPRAVAPGRRLRIPRRCRCPDGTACGTTGSGDLPPRSGSSGSHDRTGVRAALTVAGQRRIRTGFPRSEAG